MTDEVRKALEEYVEIAGITQAELADAAHKHPQQISDALRGKIGKVSGVWQALIEACGLKLVVVPADSDLDPLELVRARALAVRRSGEKLRQVSDE